MRAKGVPEKFSISDLAYSPIAEWLEGKRTAAGTAVQALNLPDSEAVSVEYACRAAQLGASEREGLSRDIQYNAGFGDVRELECSITSPGGNKLPPYRAAFSESGRHVRWNHRWMSGSFVDDSAIGFRAQGAQMSVNRRIGDVQLVLNGVAADGTCQATTSAPKKF